MPNIKEYESKSELHPSDKGINAALDAAHLYAQIGNQVGRDISRGLNDIGDAVEKHQAIMETSELYKTGTELELNLQKRYEEESALPENRGNPHFGDRFMAEIVPLLDQWGEGAKTDHARQLAATLKASIRSKIFNHVAAGQAEMDVAHVDDNITGVMGNLAAQLAIDPSERNLHQSLGTADNAIQGMTAGISDVGMREQASTAYKHRFMSELVVARYENGVGQAITNQIAETGGDTSPALEQYNKDIKNQLGFEYLSPQEQTRISKLGDEAVSRGQELYRSRNATAKSKMEQEGKAAYSEIHNAVTNLALAGQGPTPDLIASIQQFSRSYGSVLPGEVAALDDFIIRGQDRAQRNAVQPYSQSVRDRIQAGFALPVGDPRRPTLASLTRAYSAGQITKEDFATNTEILNKLDKPDKDPAFKPAWDAFQRWVKVQTAGIGGANSAYTAAARAAFEHDVTATYMARGRTAGWDDALKWISDTKHPGAFGGTEIYSIYQKAATRPPDWLKSNWVQVNEDGTITRPWAHGTGGGRPAVPAAPAHAGPPAAPKIDQKSVDDILLGKQ